MRRSELAPGPARQGGTHAGTLLAVWIVLLLCIPSVLVVGPLGAAGSPAQLLGLLAAVWWLAYQFQRSRARITPAEPTRTAMAVFGGAMLLSYVAATARPIEGLELSSADRGLLVIFSLWGITLLTTDGLVSFASLNTLLRLLTWLTAVAAVIGVLQFATGVTIVDRITIPGLSANHDIVGTLSRNGFARVQGTSMHPIEFGMVLAMVLPVALHLATHDADRARWKRYTPVLLICAGLPLAMSRSAIIAVVVLMAVLFPTWTKRQRLLALASVVVGIGVVSVAVPGMVGTMIRLFTGISSDSSAQSRTDSYALAFQFVGRSAWFGRGLATFLPTYRILDNEYLGLLVTAGFVGLLALLGLIVTALIQTSRMSRKFPATVDRSLARALMASIAGGAVACATFDAFSFPQVAGVFFFSIGCVGALHRHAAASDNSPRSGLTAIYPRSTEVLAPRSTTPSDADLATAPAGGGDLA